MTRLDFKLPDIGEGVTEGEIVEWFVNRGDEVREDDPMVEVLTDKATVTIGAPCDARVAELYFEVGGVAKVGEVILTLDAVEGANLDAAASSVASRAPGPAASAVGDIQEKVPGARLFAASASRSEATGIEYFAAKPLATPATRRLAKDMGVDIHRVRPSGPGGRVTREDVRAALGAVVGGNRTRGAAEEERRPIVGIRRKIAERMHRAKITAAHFTFVEECDASRLVELRDRLASEASRRGLRLTYLPFIVKAVTHALRGHPVLNAVVDEERHELVLKHRYHIGIATATDAGLMVPVVRDADQRRLFDLAEEIDRLARSARGGTLKPEELRDSTFTVTSLGKQGGLLATPILNYPEVGILGVHRIRKRPVVRGGQIVVGEVMMMSLSFDHRMIDGQVGAAFAYEVIETLENPERLFYEYL